MSKELDLDDVAATSDLATTELMRLRGERDDAQARIRELEAERYKLIQTVADHVTVRTEQHQKIQALKTQTQNHLVQLGTERNRALKTERERDTLRAQVQILIDLLNTICKSNPRTQLQSKLFKQTRAALATVRKPIPTNEPTKRYF